ncbi:hypothetical protein KIW84_055372 [Lathyrus oleraceus]|uniref:Uncharacterized protein n=1 Tax=Pisum sativum TaxID=3888 RepID=A0A9D4WYK0_PEA|nr:hypothetical protein KIW84_055372 [Pisum sativum]
MLKNGREVTLPTTSSIVSIDDITKVTRSGRVFGLMFPKNVEDLSGNKKVEVPAVESVSAPKCQSSESGGLKPSDDDEISVLSLLMNSEAHREALQKVLEQAYVEHDVTVDQFDHIMANITSCNNLSFCNEKLPEEGRNHNLALHISMNYKDDALSNLLVDIGSSLNVLPKSTLSKLSYQGALMRYNGVIVKAFDSSRKTVIGEVDLPVKIGPSDFQITFQVMDIHPAYSFLLGRPWIHEALLVSHLSSFSFVEAEDEIGTPFQALSIAEEKRVGAPMSSFKDALKIVEEVVRSEDVQLSFRSGGFTHGNEQHLAVVLEDDEEEDRTNFVTHGKACNKTVVDIPVSNPTEYNDPSPSPNSEFLVFEAEEESDEEVSGELSRLLEHEGKAIQPFEEQIELVNLGFKDDVKEVKIGSRLCPDVKKGLVDLLREYSYVFAWSYQDMPGLDSEIVEHTLSLKPECPPVK